MGNQGSTFPFYKTTEKIQILFTVSVLKQRFFKCKITFSRNLQNRMAEILSKWFSIF